MKYRLEFDIDFKRNTYPGRYIVLECVDGSGKTTQVERISRYFKSQSKKVIVVSEPRKKGLVGDLIQKVLYGQVKIPAVAVQYLFSADRSIHHEEIIIPALKAGTTVISDRSFWSAIVYGILDKTGGTYNDRDANAFFIAQSILSMYHQFLVADYTFYLKVSLATALSRLKKEGKKQEIYEEEGKLTKIIDGYDWLVSKFPEEFIVVEGDNSVIKVTNDILDKLPK